MSKQLELPFKFVPKFTFEYFNRCWGYSPLVYSNKDPINFFNQYLYIDEFDLLYDRGKTWEVINFSRVEFSRVENWNYEYHQPPFKWFYKDRLPKSKLSAKDYNNFP